MTIRNIYANHQQDEVEERGYRRAPGAVFVISVLLAWTESINK
jgi:hypothetical protein